jgi:hypothetical protein
MKHRWVEKTVVSPYKTERLCLHCGLIKVSRHETEGGRDRHWTEFWRGLDQIEGSGTPVCEPARADA